MLTAFDRARIALSRDLLRRLLGSDRWRRWLARPRSRPVEGQILDAHIAALLRLDDITKDSSLLGLAPALARRRAAIGIAIADAPPSLPVAVQELAWQGPSGARSARLYVPRDLERPSAGLVFFHGGGWVTGDLDTHDGLCRRLADGGRMRVIAIDYRLAPEHGFPAAPDDAIASFRWTVAQATDLGMHADRIAVGGDSAGGNLAAIVGLRCGRDDPAPALTLLLYPGLDATLAHGSHQTFAESWLLTRAMIDWYYDHYAGTSAELRRHPDLSPLHASDLSSAAPALILPAHFDPLRDEAIRYAERLEAANVPVRLHCLPSLPHGFALMTAASPAAAHAVACIARAVGSILVDDDPRAALRALELDASLRHADEAVHR